MSEISLSYKYLAQNFFSESELYTEVGIHHYSAPPGFCFDVGCDDEPIMDNPNLHDYNKDERIDTFLNIAREDFAKFKEGPENKHLIYTMGEDFQVGEGFFTTMVATLSSLISVEF